MGNHLSDKAATTWRCVFGLYAAVLLGCSRNGPSTSLPTTTITESYQIPLNSSHLQPRIYSMWGSSASDIYAGGEGFLVHWDGTSWTQITDPAIPFQNGDVVVIYGSAADNVWIVAPNSLASSIAMLRWDGTSWTPLPVPTGNFGVIWVAAPNDAWATGDTQMWHFDGTNWNSVSIPVSVSHLGSVAGVDSTHVWAASNEPAGSMQYLLRWDGASWSVVQTDFESGGVSPAADGAVWVTDSNGNFYEATPDGMITEQFGIGSGDNAGGFGGGRTDFWYTGLHDDGIASGCSILSCPHNYHTVIFHSDGHAWSQYSVGMNDTLILWVAGPNDTWFGGSQLWHQHM